MEKKESYLLDFFEEMKQKRSASYRVHTATLNSDNLSLKELEGTTKIFESFTMKDLRHYIGKEHKELLYDAKSGFSKLDFVIIGKVSDCKVTLCLYEVINSFNKNSSSYI